MNRIVASIDLKSADLKSAELQDEESKDEEPGNNVNGDELIATFECDKNDAASFHHADHVRLAFEYLCRHEALEALAKFSAALQRFAAAQGKADRYHETITWAYLLLIRERMMRQSIARQNMVQQNMNSASPAPTWDEFAASNSDLLLWKDGILATLYHAETLNSDLARRTFVMPDRLAQPSGICPEDVNPAPRPAP